jgi:hypothetical protein
MEDKMPPLNIPLIKDRIEAAHSSFLGAVGKIPDKITADHQLLLTRMITRISTILRCFEEAKIVLKILKKILKKYGLYDKYVRFKEMYFGTI